VLTVPHRLAFDHAPYRAVLGVFEWGVLGWFRRSRATHQAHGWRDFAATFWWRRHMPGRTRWTTSR
jgi:hypothetical protein